MAKKISANREPGAVRTRRELLSKFCRVSLCCPSRTCLEHFSRTDGARSCRSKNISYPKRQQNLTCSGFHLSKIHKTDYYLMNQTVEQRTAMITKGRGCICVCLPFVLRSGILKTWAKRSEKRKSEIVLRNLSRLNQGPCRRRDTRNLQTHDSVCERPACKLKTIQI